MNSDRPEGQVGARITPSARKGIHSYREQKDSQLRSEMVRYGLNESKNNEYKRSGRGSTLSNYDDGEDVVDNVQSKMARQTSPLSIRRKKLLRTNSYSQDEETDDNTNVLSKSLPATLPSHFYSGDSDLEEPNFSAHSLSKSRIEDESHQSINDRSNRSLDQHQRSPYKRRQSMSSRDNDSISSHSQKKSGFLIPLVTVGVTSMAILYIYFPNLISIKVSQEKSTQTINHDKIIFEHNMKNLQEKYNIDDNSILKLKTGIFTIFSRMDTGSFIFVYNSKTNNFNAMRFDKFVDEVAFTAARYLRNNISPIHHTVVISSNLDMQEHGELITRYRDEVDRSGVLLVKEVDEVPSELAMAFHYYCDEYEPLVKRSAIFFTLNMANCSNSSGQKSTHDFIEKCLAKKWKTVPPENMRPLLTRVVDVLIDVTSVF